METQGADKSGLTVPASSERQQNLAPEENHLASGFLHNQTEHKSHVQGKFKPFQKVSPPLHNHPERETVPTEAPIEMTISIPDLVVTEELSTCKQRA